MDKILLKEDGSSKIFERSSKTWILHKFSNICDEYKIDMSLSSLTFPETESASKWEIQLYPNGKTDSENSISVYIYKCDDSVINAKYLLRLQTSDDEIICERNDEANFDVDGWGYKDLFNRDDLKFKLKDDVLKIYVTIWAEILTLKPNHRINTSQEKTSLIKLQNELKIMFQTKEFSDFLIKLDDSSEIPVHKNILATRSSVFSAMFKNKTLENKVGYVDIRDIDKNTMMLLLNFVYTGSLNSDISEETMKKLLPAADKYELLDLKQLCAENLTENLKVSNVVDILLLAEMYNMSEMKNSAFEYILENIYKFSDKTKFQKVEKKFPNLLTELIVKMIKTSEPKSKIKT